MKPCDVQHLERLPAHTRSMTGDDPLPIVLYTYDTGADQVMPAPFMSYEDAAAAAPAGAEVIGFFIWFHRRAMLPMVLFEQGSVLPAEPRMVKLRAEDRIAHGMFPFEMNRSACTCAFARETRAWYERWRQRRIAA